MEFLVSPTRAKGWAEGSAALGAACTLGMGEPQVPFTTVSLLLLSTQHWKQQGESQEKVQAVLSLSFLLISLHIMKGGGHNLPSLNWALNDLVPALSPTNGVFESSKEKQKLAYHIISTAYSGSKESLNMPVICLYALFHHMLSVYCPGV